MKLKLALSLIQLTALSLAFLAPDVSAAIPQRLDIEIGDMIDEDESMTGIVTKVFGWLMVICSILLGVAVLGTFGFGVFDGLRKLQDDKEHKNYTIGNWVQTLIIGTVSSVIVIVIAWFIYDFGSGLIR
jgi:ABC-type Fe3+ transport system permease subunit